MWETEEEVVSARISGVDSEMEISAIPIERTIEIASRAEITILPIQEDIAQIEVTLAPVYAVEIIVGINAHEIIQVNLVGSLILIVCQIEFVSHLVSKEQSLLASLLITHCRSCSKCHAEHCYKCYNQLLHNRILIKSFTSVSFFCCKGTTKVSTRVRIFPKLAGEYP